MGLSSQVTVHMPEQGLEDDHRERDRGRRARGRCCSSARRRTSSIASPAIASTDARDVLALHVQRDRDRHQQRPRRSPASSRSARRRAASSASASTSTPSAPAIMRCTCSRQALCVSNGRIALAAWSLDLVRGARPRRAAVAGRPVRAAQAGIRQAHERAEHDHAQRERDGEPGEAMEVPVDGGPGTAGLGALGGGPGQVDRCTHARSCLTSASAAWPGRSAGRPDRSRQRSAESRNRSGRSRRPARRAALAGDAVGSASTAATSRAGRIGSQQPQVRRLRRARGRRARLVAHNHSTSTRVASRPKQFPHGVDVARDLACIRCRNRPAAPPRCARCGRPGCHCVVAAIEQLRRQRAQVGGRLAAARRCSCMPADASRRSAARRRPAWLPKNSAKIASSSIRLRLRWRCVGVSGFMDGSCRALRKVRISAVTSTAIASANHCTA